MGTAGGTALPAEPSARPEARRCVILDEGAPTPSADYLLLPWLRALALPIVHADGRRKPSASDLEAGDLVVISRYVPSLWRRPLVLRHPELAGLAYFMDDDLLDPAAHAGFAAPYARKLATLASSQRRWLESNADEFWVSTPALVAKYATLRPRLLPLAPPAHLLGTRPAVRIVYHGTASHAGEIDWLHAVIEALQARCEHTHFSLFGEHPVHRSWQDLPRISVLHPMRWENYLAYTASQPADIGLAPLLPGAFNAARGPVKFFDYARMGAVGVYADVEPYRGFVRDGVDGLLLPLDPARWVDTLAALAQPGAPLLDRLRAGVRERVATYRAV
ncbi:MAG TPA: glycosyltransferase family 1 protein [Burkholderiaceae bacterium]|nr:glycosyltransferase family 1 protein [Burkholderiaceae bacterium]